MSAKILPLGPTLPHTNDVTFEQSLASDPTL
jgi:hypothetical protein